MPPRPQYTFVRDFRILEADGVRTYVVLAKSHTFASNPEKSGVIRVDSFEQSCIMQSDGKVGSKGAALKTVSVHSIDQNCRH